MQLTGDQPRDPGQVDGTPESMRSGVSHPLDDRRLARLNHTKVRGHRVET